MKHYVQTLVLVLTLVSVPGAGFGEKPFGDVVDPDTLLKVQSYCVDMDKIEGVVAPDVRRFLEKQNTPKGLLSKLPWKLVENCAQADAVVSLEFKNSFQVTQANGDGMATGAAITQSVPEATYTAQMLVSDRTSRKPLYKVMGESITVNRERSIGSPFSKLIHDLKVVSK
jgi:hypothetical protein